MPITLCHAICFKKQTIIYKKEVTVAKILYIKEGVSKGRVLIGVDDGEDVKALSVTESTYLAIGAPTRYTELLQRDLDSLITEDERYRAMKKAVSILAASDKSSYTLKMKLYQAGFSRESADEAVNECIGRGYIDEDRQLRRLIEREANESLRGRFYIKRKLVSKGYRGADIDRIINELTDIGEVDFDANFERLAEKKGALDDEARLALKYKFGYKA